MKTLPPETLVSFFVSTEVANYTVEYLNSKGDGLFTKNFNLMVNSPKDGKIYSFEEKFRASRIIAIILKEEVPKNSHL
jgi:hypothetical protein